MSSDLLKNLEDMYSEPKKAKEESASEMEKARIEIQKANIELLQVAEELKEKQQDRELSTFKKVMDIINGGIKDVAEEQKMFQDATKGFLEKYNDFSETQKEDFKKTYDQLISG